MINQILSVISQLVKTLALPAGKKQCHKAGKELHKIAILSTLLPVAFHSIQPV